MTVLSLALVVAACGDDPTDGPSAATTAVPSSAAPATTAAPSTAPPSTAAPSTTGPGTGTGIDWEPCEPGFECAKVPVPLDWSDPTGEQIELAVIRYPATKPDQRIGSMFVNPGGPGDTGVGSVLDSSSELSESGDGRFDIVSWDPRGTHGSSPMHCFDDDAEEAAFWKDVVVPYSTTSRPPSS